MRLIDADELITAFPCGESVRTESVRATINHMPTFEVSEDAISRTKLKEDLEAWAMNLAIKNMLVKDDVFVVIDNAPSVGPQAKEGEWIIHPNALLPEESTLECSVCHEEQPGLLQSFWIDKNFCPNCRAKMKGAE